MYVLPNGQLSGICQHPGNYGSLAGYDDGTGYWSATDQPYGLAGIFGSIKKAVSSVGKAVGTVAKTAVKTVGKGVQLAAKVAPVAVAFIPGVGIPAAAAIVAGTKLVSGITKKESVGQIAQDTVVGAAEGAAAGAVNKVAFKGQGFKGAGQLLGIGKPKQPAASASADAQARSALAAAGKKQGFGQKLAMPTSRSDNSDGWMTGTGFIPKVVNSGLPTYITPQVPEGGFPISTMPVKLPGGSTVKGKVAGVLNKLVGSGKKVARDAIAATVTPSGGAPAAAGGGGFNVSVGGSGSSPGVIPPVPVESGAGLGSMMPMLLIGGAALLVLAPKGRR